MKRWLVVLPLLCGCVPARAPDAGCVVACKHLTDLGCEEGGVLCVERCDEYQSGGLDQNTGCLARVSSCEDTVDCAMQ
jgi:hypothetical protein